MSAPPEFRRRVFYIPGFDPAPPRRYREIYRREGLLQAEISGYSLTTYGKTPATGPHGWRARTTISGVTAEAELSVLTWRDIVKAEMGGGLWATYGQMLRTAWAYIGSGALWRLMKLRKGPVIAALYPVVLLLMQALIAFGLAALLLWVGISLVGGVLGALLGAAVGILAAGAVFFFFKKHDNRIFAHYLMHDYAFAARWKGANPPALEERLSRWGAEIRQALESGYDEVLVVGHSSGAHLGVSVLADLHRAGLGEGGSALAFLSLGQCVPMMSYLPEATKLRADLQYLSEQEEIAWVDVTAPGDACSFALCDPVAVSGVAREGQKWPLVLSAAFTKTLSPARRKEMKWRFFRRHFQYLASFDRPADYDYFKITAGGLGLRERYLNKKHTPLRKTLAANKFTKIQ